MSRQEQATYRPFPVTEWSLIARTADPDADTRRRALTELLDRYVPAVKFYLTLAKRIDPDRADDLLQGFLASKVLDEHLIEHADRERGKFRTFLLTALDRFIINQHRFDAAQKRSPGQMASIDEQPEPAGNGSGPASAFELAWARQVIDRTLERMRQECLGSGRLDLWEVFNARVLGPTLGQAEAIPYDDLVRRAGFASPVRAANALVTAKRMFTRVLRGVISEYETDEDEIDGEIDDLHKILARS
jgi:DNA-directed RNA polymerase specialized sigma24 family protein